jgi:hypothetical protein
VEPETFTLPEYMSSPFGFQWGSCYSIFSFLCVMFGISLFVLLTFLLLAIFVVCPSIYRYWLPLCYLQALPVYISKGNNLINLPVYISKGNNLIMEDDVVGERTDAHQLVKYFKWALVTSLRFFLFLNILYVFLIVICFMLKNCEGFFFFINKYI